MERSVLNENQFYIRKMLPDENVSEFDCSDVALNSFIQETAPNFQKALLSVTYVLTLKTDPGKVLGFFSLANDSIALSNFSKLAEFKSFRRLRGLHDQKRLRSYPAVKLCRIGVDQSVRGLGAGTMLLDYVKTNLVTDPKSACRFVSVDAYIDVIPFYEKNGFCLLNDDDKDSEKTRLLYFDLKEIA